MLALTVHVDGALWRGDGAGFLSRATQGRTDYWILWSENRWMTRMPMSNFCPRRPINEIADFDLNAGLSNPLDHLKRTIPLRPEWGGLSFFDPYVGTCPGTLWHVERWIPMQFSLAGWSVCALPHLRQNVLNRLVRSQRLGDITWHCQVRPIYQL